MRGCCRHSPRTLRSGRSKQSRLGFPAARRSSTQATRADSARRTRRRFCIGCRCAQSMVSDGGRERYRHGRSTLTAGLDIVSLALSVSSCMRRLASPSEAQVQSLAVEVGTRTGRYPCISPRPTRRDCPWTCVKSKIESAGMPGASLMMLFRHGVGVTHLLFLPSSLKREMRG